MLWNTQMIFARRRHPESTGDDYNPSLYGLGLKMVKVTACKMYEWGCFIQVILKGI